MTKYKLACGQVFNKTIGADKIEIYMEHTAYHVRRFSRFIDGKLVKEAWLVFDTLKEAKQAYKRQIEIAKAINS